MDRLAQALHSSQRACLAIGVFRSFAPSSSAVTRRCGPETAMREPQTTGDKLPAIPANPRSIDHT